MKTYNIWKSLVFVTIVKQTGSGTGKPTLKSWLYQDSYEMWHQDICVLASYLSRKVTCASYISYNDIVN